MRQSVELLSQFYATAAGQVVRTILRARIQEAWQDTKGLDVLGIGYTTPIMDMFSDSRRALMAMPGAQGAEIWPQQAKVRSVLVEEEALPFATGLFDRIVMVHALEEAKSPSALLNEASRLLAPNGKLIIAVASRNGLWARSEKTPFGHGQPYSRSQLEKALNDAELEPLAWSYALYTPPLQALMGWAGAIERYAPLLVPLNGGLILMEAARRPFVAQTRAQERSLMDEVRDLLTGSPVPTAQKAALYK